MSELIESVNEAEPLDAVGAFVRGVQKAMDDVYPHLDHATPEQVSTLWELCRAIEGTAALNQARIRRQDGIAHEQNKAHEERAKHGDDGMTPTNEQEH